MARVTVEDCLQYVKNRFDLVLKASKRARQLELGEVDSLVPMQGDKMTVVALREIASGADITKARLRRDNSEVVVANYRAASSTVKITSDEPNETDI